MKLCLLADAANIHTQRWARYFAHACWEVHVVSFSMASIDGVIVHPITNLGALGKWKYLISAPAVRRTVRSIKPDLLHTHYATSYGLLGTLSGHRPLIVSAWGSDIFAGAAHSPLLRATVRLAFRRADRICATSAALASAAAKHLPPGKEIAITPFGVNCEQFRPRGSPIRQTVVGSVRRLDPIYGLRHLIDAFPQLIGSNPDARLVLVGDGPQRTDLAARIAKLRLHNVAELRGYVPHTQIPAVLHELSIFATPSICHEAFGVAAIEASASGLPVVASRIGGLPEVVAHEETGLLIPPGDVRSLAEALTLLSTDHALAHRLGVRGREFVLANYEWAENAGRMARLYTETIATYRGGSGKAG